MTDREITIKNAIGLLKECVANSEGGMEALFAWAMNERDLIQVTIKELEDTEGDS